MDLISIIVPIYNTEKYLNRCIDSIINQTYKNLEIVLVDDGSTDKSGVICDDYAKSDSRIKVIHKENGGVSSARNVGIDNATGEYIMFVDADDELCLNAIEYIMELSKKNNADLICFQMKELEDIDDVNVNIFHKKIYSDIYINSSNISNGFFELYSNSNLFSPCNKLYKKSVVKNNNLKFDTKLSLLEDFEFNIRYMRVIESIYSVDEELYIRHWMPQSIESKGRFSFNQIPYIEYIQNAFLKYLKEKNIEMQPLYYSEYICCIDVARMWNLKNPNYTFFEKYKMNNDIFKSKIFKESLKYRKETWKTKVRVFLYKTNYLFILPLDLLGILKTKQKNRRIGL